MKNEFPEDMHIKNAQAIAAQVAAAERNATAQQVQAQLSAMQPIHPVVVPGLNVLHSGLGVHSHVAIESFKSLLLTTDAGILRASADERRDFLDSIALVACEAAKALVSRMQIEAKAMHAAAQPTEPPKPAEN